jgi:hypothetical protein
MSNGFEPHSSACYNFKKDKELQKATVWLAPTTITQTQDDKTTLIKWSCSLGKSCEFAECIYAKNRGSDS